MIWAFVEIKGKIIASKFENKKEVPKNHTIIAEKDIQDKLNEFRG